MPIELAIRIAEGITAKLNFDFACNRGHSFGEYHVHGVVNELLWANLDPAKRRVSPGYPHPSLQTSRARGRKREVDFLVETLDPVSRDWYAEVKWAGSSHCAQDRVLLDLCRLQIIKNAELGAECLFILAGLRDDIDTLFRSGILESGTQCLLHRPGNRGMAAGHGRRTKVFRMMGNPDHAVALTGMRVGLTRRLPVIPDYIYTVLTYSGRSAPQDGRFQTLVWTVEKR